MILNIFEAQYFPCHRFRKINYSARFYLPKTIQFLTNALFTEATRGKQ